VRERNNYKGAPDITEEVLKIDFDPHKI